MQCTSSRKTIRTALLVFRSTIRGSTRARESWRQDSASPPSPAYFYFFPLHPATRKRSIPLHHHLRLQRDRNGKELQPRASPWMPVSPCSPPCARCSLPVLNPMLAPKIGAHFALSCVIACNTSRAQPSKPFANTTSSTTRPILAPRFPAICGLALWLAPRRISNPPCVARIYHRKYWLSKASTSYLRNII